MTAGAYELAVAGHVVAVIAAFGTLFAYPWLPAGNASAHLARERVLSVVVTRSAVLALMIGLYLANDRAYLGEVWVLVPLAIMVMLLGIVAVALLPRERRLAAMADADSDRSRVERELAIAGILCACLVAVATFFMVTKPGW